MIRLLVMSCGVGDVYNSTETLLGREDDNVGESSRCVREVKSPTRSNRG